MGSPADEQDRDVDEGPQTTVTLTHPYWIGQHEVTQAEFTAVMGSNPSAFTGDTLLPVEQVTWTEAQTYCAKLTQRELASGHIPQGLQYRLPTEAEWERAARAGTTTRFSFGNDPQYTDLADYGWFVLNSNASTHPVAQKLPNDAGLFDMNGNVSEWCQDWYASYPGGSVMDPSGPVSGVQRVVRGGSYYYDGWLARSASRNAFPPNTRKPDIGFRWVLSTQ
jgi:formylglycine-generating enzyme required for sulfatase activity